jgi:hypothetical protein
VGAVLSNYIERERAKVNAYLERKRLKSSANTKKEPTEPKPSYIPLSFCERAERIISELVVRKGEFPALTESMLRDVQGGTSFRNDAYDLRQAMSRSPDFGLDMNGVTALDLILTAAGLANAAHRHLCDLAQVRGSGLNPVVQTRAAQREAARKGDPDTPSPPVIIGRRKANEKPGFQAPDPYEGKEGLDAKILSEAPFFQVIELLKTACDGKVPRFIEFELFPIAYKLAGNKPEILSALLLPESIGTFSSRAPFYTDLKNALAARKEKIPSVAVAEKIVKAVLRNRELGKMADYNPKSEEALKGVSGKSGRANVQKQEELPEQFIKSLPPILDPDARSKGW